MSALVTTPPSGACQESKAPLCLTHALAGRVKRGGVGPVTASQPRRSWASSRASSQPGPGSSSSSIKTSRSSPDSSRARLRPATIPGTGSWT